MAVEGTTSSSIPLVGWLMHMAGDIKLIRGKRDSIVAAMDACKDRLSKNVSVMIFPEGTRSDDGELRKFKDGAFRLAIETGTPILPLVLDGTHPALQKGDWRFGVADAEVRVLEPVETAGLKMEDLSVLTRSHPHDDRRRARLDEGRLTYLLREAASTSSTGCRCSRPTRWFRRRRCPAVPPR